MAETSVEARLSTLEQEFAQLKQQLRAEKPETNTSQVTTPWWKKIVGVYKDDPEFDEAERLGREYRESQRLKDDENSV